MILYKDRSLHVYVMALLLLLAMWLLAGWNSYNYDYAAYEGMFYRLDGLQLFTDNDIGYVFINKLFRENGADFTLFRISMYFVFLSFIGIFIFKYARKPLPVLLIYFAVIFFRDAILMRNTLAQIPLYIGFGYLLYGNNTYKNAIYYSICIAVSSCIHASYMYYFILLLVYTNKIPSPKTILIIVVGLSFIGKNIILSILGSNFLAGNETLQFKGNAYLTDGSLPSLVLSTVTVVYTTYLICRFTKLNGLLTIHNEDIKIRKYITLSMSIIVLTYMNMEFIRLFFNLFLFNCVYILNRYYTEMRSFTNKLLILFWLIWNFLWITVMSGVGQQVAYFVNYNLLFT